MGVRKVAVVIHAVGRPLPPPPQPPLQLVIGGGLPESLAHTWRWRGVGRGEAMHGWASLCSRRASLLIWRQSVLHYSLAPVSPLYQRGCPRRGQRSDGSQLAVA